MSRLSVGKRGIGMTRPILAPTVKRGLRISDTLYVNVRLICFFYFENKIKVAFQISSKGFAL